MANWPVVERARVVYCTGFFITVSPDAIRKVAAHCAENDKIFAMVRACVRPRACWHARSVPHAGPG